ncbi:MAG TPA: hypothetical protein DEP03_06605 [Massilia sp.]|nr:hypothetical protein [Massilia sp.]
MNQMSENSAATAGLEVKTWRARIGVGADFPLHAPTDVERAMEAEIAELRAELLPLNEDTTAILGRPNFTCIGIAAQLRKLGHKIGNRAENEQAAVIHFLLNMYQKHGAAWRQNAEEYLRQETKQEG